MKSLIIVSNRLPFIVSNNEDGTSNRVNSAGGLVTALTPLVINSNGFWIGWAGKELCETMSIPESDDATSIAHNLKSSQIVPIYFEEETYKNYYNGMCNASLWPLLHSLPTHTIFSSSYWSSYVEVNTTFSNACLETLKKISSKSSETIDVHKNNLVWIHDYHLLMLPMMLKNKIDDAGISCRIAFFLHVPFPSWDIFR